MRARAIFYQFPAWNSLTLRVTLGVLIVALAGIWSLFLYAGHSLRLDMQRELGAQQASMAAYVASTVQRELDRRLDALHQLTPALSPQLPLGTDTLARELARLPVFQSMFNGGSAVLALAGSPLAQYGTALDHAPLDTAEIGALVQAARAGQTDIVYVSPHQRIVLGAPLHGPNGDVQALLLGVIALERPHFLELMANASYGQAGAYLLYSLAQQQVITASTVHDMPMALAHAPVGTSLVQAPDGREHLVTVRALERAPWQVAVALPASEAFAPASAQQRRLVLATLVLTAVVVVVCMVWIRYLLAPLLHTTRAIATRTETNALDSALATTGQHETDQLVQAFNRLLGWLRARNDALLESMQLNQDTLDSVGVHIAVLDAQGRVVRINAPWQRFANTVAAQAAAAPGQAWSHLFTGFAAQGEGDTAQALHDGVASVLAGTAQRYTVEGQWTDALGQAVWFHASITPLGQGRAGAVVACTDVSERRRAQGQLLKLSQVAHQAPLSVVITDLGGNIEYTNPYFSEKTQYSADEVLGKNPRILQSGQTPALVYEDLWTTLRARRVWRGELHNRKKDGALFVERAIIAPVLNVASEVTHYVALKEDVTEERVAEKNRLALTLQVEALSRRLVHSQEEIRQRFSQELHDRTSPNLAALRINLDIIAQALGQHATAPLPELVDRIEDTRALIEDTNASIREICAGLHPAAIERGGLLGVIRSYAQQFAKRTGMVVEVQCPHAEQPLPPDLELALFRTVQEALTNCAKHARARQVDVRLQFDRSPILLSICDDGVGFVVPEGQPLQGLGLINMREAVEFAGGHLRIESQPGSGTQIYIAI